MKQQDYKSKKTQHKHPYLLHICQHVDGLVEACGTQPLQLVEAEPALLEQLKERDVQTKKNSK
jgi:hypothetical protein